MMSKTQPRGKDKPKDKTKKTSKKEAKKGVEKTQKTTDNKATKATHYSPYAWGTKHECDFILGIGKRGATREPRLLVLQRYRNALKDRKNPSFDLDVVMKTLDTEIENELALQDRRPPKLLDDAEILAVTQ